ncbi:hypothetical protein NMY22_g13781 [Coprinellus aureogranulatus]|nr:hypothetical protein NMY22_g13781 [Coprinellus aureogranulatus]
MYLPRSSWHRFPDLDPAPHAFLLFDSPLASGTVVSVLYSEPVSEGKLLKDIVRPIFWRVPTQLSYDAAHRGPGSLNSPFRFSAVALSSRGLSVVYSIRSSLCYHKRDAVACGSELWSSQEGVQAYRAVDAHLLPPFLHDKPVKFKSGVHGSDTLTRLDPLGPTESGILEVADSGGTMLYDRNLRRGSLTSTPLDDWSQKLTWASKERTLVVKSIASVAASATTECLCSQTRTGGTARVYTMVVWMSSSSGIIL